MLYVLWVTCCKVTYTFLLWVRLVERIKSFLPSWRLLYLFWLCSKCRNSYDAGSWSTVASNFIISKVTIEFEDILGYILSEIWVCRTSLRCSVNWGILGPNRPFAHISHNAPWLEANIHSYTLHRLKSKRSCILTFD